MKKQYRALPLTLSRKNEIAEREKIYKRISIELAYCGRYFPHGWFAGKCPHPRFVLHLATLSECAQYLSEVEKANMERRLIKQLNVYIPAQAGIVPQLCVDEKGRYYVRQYMRKHSGTKLY